MSSVCIIPARIGSKRIEKKNIKNFLGKPILSYVIKEALSSGIFDEVMVSTDSEEISEVAKASGAKIPFLRSPKNSDDFAGTEEVLLEVEEKYRQTGIHFEEICCIYPTAVLLTAGLIKETNLAFHSNQYTALFTAVKYGHPIQRSFRTENGFAVLNWPEHRDTRTQDLQPMYHDCGYLYWIRTEALLEKKTLFTERTGLFVLKENQAQDIDTSDDWKIAELKYKALHGLG
jgi:N-acylneuraminate cytidylyltransferase